MSDTKQFLKIAGILGIAPSQVKSTVQLLDEGATVPFISRYRKEATGSLDEVQVAAVRDHIESLRTMEQRREFILTTIEDQGKLTPELKEKILEAETILQLEDLYLPYKPRRKTRATAAREKGLEPLAQRIFAQENFPVETEAALFVDASKDVNSPEEALDGARDIIAEWISENAEAREKLRVLFRKQAMVRSRVVPGKEDDGEKFSDYFEWNEPLHSCPSHRMLAMRRGEKEGFLFLDIAPDAEESIDLLERHFVKGRNEASEQVKAAVLGSYKRLLQPSLETEFRQSTKESADEKAIVVFAENLRELLLAAPLGQKTMLAIDPGFRTGCKIVVLNRQGKLLADDVIYPHSGQQRDAQRTIVDMVNEYKVEAIAIGNGTAGRETEEFVRNISVLPKDVIIVMVNESGASIYSASDVAREEFPTKDVTVRGAVSIGRRLADPLAELVKIDPKSIGVGQYQHDVDQTLLKKKLDEVVESCVNGVGVELNTASKQLLTYVSGLGAQLAQNIVDFRNENGPFQSRQELLKVPRLGAKAFEQAAGFLRIRNGKNPLDASAVHPEAYPVVEKMASDIGCTLDELIREKELRKKIDAKKYVTEKVGLPTLNDILSELDKPGRDPRKSFEVFKFEDGVNSIEDLRPGMKLPGIVTNVTNFGAFVDIGVHQDGLVHVSQLADRFVDDPNKVVKVGQQVKVTVTEVDVRRKRIALSMKGEVQQKPQQQQQQKGGNTKNNSASKSSGNDWQDQLNALKGKFSS